MIKDNLISKISIFSDGNVIGRIVEMSLNSF
jgi:hypothetical protein